MGPRENKCQISQDSVSCVRCYFVKFDIYFLRLQQEIFFGVVTDD